MFNTIMFLVKFALVIFAFGYALPRAKAFSPVSSSGSSSSTLTSHAGLLHMAATLDTVAVDAASVDFTGTWSRQWELCTDLASALEARGLSPEQALAEAQAPYVQSWERDAAAAPAAWKVVTYQRDGVTPRRTLTYAPGIWEERYRGSATLFGDSGEDNEVILERETSYVPEVDANPIPLAHLTVTKGPKGVEESRRYLRDGQMILRRTLHPQQDSTQPVVVSTEVFTKQS